MQLIVNDQDHERPTVAAPRGLRHAAGPEVATAAATTDAAEDTAPR